MRSLIRCALYSWVIACSVYPAYSQAVTLNGPCGGADEVSAEMNGAAIVFTYTNDALGTSSPCTQEVTVGEHTITFQIWINVSGTMSERFAVTPPDGYMAIPEYIDAEDGMEGEVLVLPMMF